MPRRVLYKAEINRHQKLKDSGSTQTRYCHTSSDPTVNAVRYMSHGCCDEQMDRHTTFKDPDKISKIYKLEDLTLPEKHFAYCDRLVNTPTHFESIWNGPLGSSKAIQLWYQIKLGRSNSRPGRSAPYGTGTNAWKRKKQEINRMIVTDSTSHSQTRWAFSIAFLS